MIYVFIYKVKYRLHEVSGKWTMFDDFREL
jgi:hypothetical protein